MAIDVEIPRMGESISEVILIEWLKGDGDYVERDEAICILETDKANVDLPSPAAGVLRHAQEVDATLAVGAVIAQIVEGEKPAATPAIVEGKGVAVAAESDDGREQADAAVEPKGGGEKGEAIAVTEHGKGAAAAERLSPAARRLAEEHGVDAGAIAGTGKDGRITKEDVQTFVKMQKRQSKEAPPVEEQKTAAVPAVKEAVVQAVAATKPAVSVRPVAVVAEGDGERREPMSRMRQRIAQHLVAAQQNAAMLTTFNEVDLSAVIGLRTQYKERFTEVHGVSLGFMSFFSRAAVLALREFPTVNASIDGSDIVYHDYVHLGIAVSTERGLVVPILRHVEQLSMAQIESEIKRLALGARDNKLALDELSGGTFTITNGGVFGSLLSTPIINAPQSGILGMHAIQQRPIAIDGEVVIRPMMYVALSYDHRIIDGQQSVKFLVRLKQLVEDPARLILEV